MRSTKRSWIIAALLASVMAGLGGVGAWSPTHAHAAGCVGSACDNKDPYALGCTDSLTYWGGAGVSDSNGVYLGSVNLYLSNTCSDPAYKQPVYFEYFYPQPGRNYGYQMKLAIDDVTARTSSAAVYPWINRNVAEYNSVMYMVPPGHTVGLDGQFYGYAGSGSCPGCSSYSPERATPLTWHWTGRRTS